MIDNLEDLFRKVIRSVSNGNYWKRLLAEEPKSSLILCFLVPFFLNLNDVLVEVTIWWTNPQLFTITQAYHYI